MKKKNIAVLDDKEKQLIRALNHPVFTVDFLEDWLQNPPKNVKSDVMAAALNEQIKGFITAVKQLKQSCVRCNLDDIYTNEYLAEDISSLFEENDDELLGSIQSSKREELKTLLQDETFMDQVLDRFRYDLDENDSFWDAYWSIARNAVKEVLKEKK